MDNATKKYEYLDFDGLNIYHTELMKNVAPKSHTHSEFNNLTHFKNGIHICNRAEEVGDGYLEYNSPGIYFSDNVEDSLDSEAHVFIKEEGDNRLRIHSDYALDLSAGGVSIGGSPDSPDITIGYNGPSIRLEYKEYKSEMAGGMQEAEETNEIQISADGGIYLNASGGVYINGEKYISVTTLNSKINTLNNKISGLLARIEELEERVFGGPNCEEPDCDDCDDCDVCDMVCDCIDENGNGIDDWEESPE